MNSFPRYLSFAVGFLSLSQEILWVKLVSFIHQTVPQAFSFVLMLYLFGIALGADIGKNICKRSGNLYRVAFWVLLSACVLDVLFPLSTAYVAGLEVNDSIKGLISICELLVQVIVIVVTSGLKGIIFPIAHHLGTVEQEGKVGTSLSNVYFCNIVGSMLGPIVTGFYLLDVMTLQNCFLLVAFMTLGVSAACGIKSGIRPVSAIPVTGIIGGIFITLCFTPEMLISAIANEHKLKHLIQNRQGIIHTYEGGAGGDLVYGGNTYDGRFNTSLIINSNGINRAYIVATFHPKPKRVLIVGLASASWAKVLSGIDGVEQLDIIEINPGYLELVRRTPEVSSILKDKRVHIHIDDARRWLKLHQDARYDLIAMNTTWYFKNFTTNLVSKEFLELVKRHLTPEGVLFYNSTGSNDIFKTASVVFKHAYLYANFVAASDQDIKERVVQLHDRVYATVLDGKPALVESRDADREAVRLMFEVPLVSLEDVQARMRRPLEVITDQNMITEFKYGRGF